MIISDSIAPIETIALPEPYQRSLGSIPSEGWESVLKIAESGRVWRLEFGADARPQTRPTGLELRRELEFDDFDPIDFAADRLVLEFDEHLHVFDVSTGRVRLRVSVRDGGGASCLTPDGRLLLRFNEDETKIWTFGEEPAPLRTTRIFHEGSGPLPLFGYEPQSARCVSRPGSGGGFHVVVGHLGFAVAYSLHPGDFAQPELRLDEPRRIHQGFICDPVTTIIGSRHPFVAVNEGYGCGLQLIDVETGDSRSCPEVVTSRLGYCRYHRSTPCGERNKTLVRTIDGWFLWDLATDAVIPFCSLDWELLHVGPERLWAIRDGDQASLRCYPSALRGDAPY
jgi:hypothetical protein